MERDKSKSEEEIRSTESLHEHHCCIAAQGQSPLRVDKFLMTRIENATRNKIQQAAKSGSIFVGENAVKSNYKVKGGDHISFVMVAEMTRRTSSALALPHAFAY